MSKQARTATQDAVHGATGQMRKGRGFTVGTVFILVANQAAGERSLVEAVVTTSRALWHVNVPEELRVANSTRGERYRNGGAQLDAWCMAKS